MQILLEDLFLSPNNILLNNATNAINAMNAIDAISMAITQFLKQNKLPNHPFIHKLNLI